MMSLIKYANLLATVGNIIFTLAGLPMLLTAYKNRENLKGISPMANTLLASGSVCFMLMNFILRFWLAFLMCVWNFAAFIFMVYWSRKVEDK